MSLLWTIPPLAVATGALLVIVQLGGMAEAAEQLQVELRRFSEVDRAVAQVRAASADAGATARGLLRA